MLAAEVRDDGVDFDCIDVGGAIAQRGRHIVAGAGADHQNVQRGRGDSASFRYW